MSVGYTLDERHVHMIIFDTTQCGSLGRWYLTYHNLYPIEWLDITIMRHTCFPLIDRKFVDKFLLTGALCSDDHWFLAHVEPVAKMPSWKELHTDKQTSTQTNNIHEIHCKESGHRFLARHGKHLPRFSHHLWLIWSERVSAANKCSLTTSRLRRFVHDGLQWTGGHWPGMCGRVALVHKQGPDKLTLVHR